MTILKMKLSIDDLWIRVVFCKDYVVNAAIENIVIN